MSIHSGDENLKCLYKYRAASGPDRQDLALSTKDLLENGHLYFAYPDEFNDPFDSRVEIVADGTDAEKKAYLKSKHFDEARINTLFAKARAGQFQWSELASEEYLAAAKLLRIYCLSRHNDNMLLWSHYASEHTGICVGIRTYVYGNSICLKSEAGAVGEIVPGLDPRYLPTVRVDYSPDRPRPYNIFTGSPKDIQPFLTTKSISWKYEDEYRVLLINRAVKTNPIPVAKSEIAEVVFGANCKRELQKKVVDILHSYPDHGRQVTLLKSVLKPHTYELEVVPF